MHIAYLSVKYTARIRFPGICPSRQNRKVAAPFHFSGNAEIMRLVTQAQAHKETSDNQGKHMIMQRFIQDQNQNQFSVQENIHTDEWRTYDDNVSRENDVRWVVLTGYVNDDE